MLVSQIGVGIESLQSLLCLLLQPKRAVVSSARRAVRHDDVGTHALPFHPKDRHRERTQFTSLIQRDHHLSRMTPPRAQQYRVTERASALGCGAVKHLASTRRPALTRLPCTWLEEIQHPLSTRHRNLSFANYDNLVDDRLCAARA